MDEARMDCQRRRLNLGRWLPFGLAMACLVTSASGFSLPLAAARAQAGCASTLIDEVNRLRASYGLGPLSPDPTLMSVTQAQTDYRVATGGAYGHSGPGGSRPRDRAIAAGYGSGMTVFISENYVDGTGLTPAEAVQWWTGDDPHLNTMIGQYYRDIGAGCGASGDYAYFTIMSGYVAGGYSASGYYGTLTAGPPLVAPVPIYLSTPASDGSIIHTVQPGQTLWTIAAVYGIDLADLLELNGLRESSLLHPGDEIIVQLPSTATPSPAPTLTPWPTSTRRPAVSPTSLPFTPAPAAPASSPRSPLSLGLIAAGALLAAAGFLFALRRR
jgi:uncharacterized protein YkwD